MGFKSGVITRRAVLHALSLTVVFNTVIALFLTALDFGEGLRINFIFSQCIGLCICSLFLITHRFLNPVRPIGRFIQTVATMVAGALAGSVIGAVAAGFHPSIFIEKNVLLFRLLLLGLVFGTIISYFFYSREKILAAEAQIRDERIKRLTIEKQAAEAHLKLLQAQVEPHFLFNTLSNVLSLLDTDTGRAKSMLLDFIRYLRTGLSEIRGPTIRLHREMDMIRTYLNIFKVRMGNRLQYDISLAPNLEQILFPPMLLQPLVENAIKHGLAHKVEGGRIAIRVEEKNGLLRLEVADDGPGLSADRGAGLGLSSIRQRLDSIYGEKARLILEENVPAGLKAVIEVPCAAD